MLCSKMGLANTAVLVVAADPATHRVLFPLESGPKGTPVLRILRPCGT